MSELKNRLRVAVRVRPFSQREVSMGCKRIIDMEGTTTVLTHPTDQSDRKSFSFNQAYWSFDGFIEDPSVSGRKIPDPSHQRGDRYCDQEKLFADLGRVMLADTFEGYNTTLFSYGQTGSGKSYSVLGYGPNQGIIQQFCHQVFRIIEEKTYISPTNFGQFEVRLSMLEIYNEAVYDLLTTSKNGRGLKVREHPKKGFYADGLSDFQVANYSDIEQLLGQGTLNRTVVATNMNTTSSRSHMIVTIRLMQKRTTNGGEVTTTSVVNIVDLAGSERTRKTGDNDGMAGKESGNTSGERFREGVSINKSLQSLGNAIHILAESSFGSSSQFSNHVQKGPRVPYRDSVLTKLLMHALGGNSKTIMLASISPADIHYEETLSTLPDRAKQIRTRPAVNKNSTEKLVRDLEGENQRLKAVLTRGNIDPQWLKTVVNGRQTNPQAMKDAKIKWETELRAQLRENEREIQQIRSPQHIQHKELKNVAMDTSIESQRNPERTGPYLQNVNMDPLLDGRWIHYLKKGTTLIGTTQASASTIEMIGPGMKVNHAEISVQENNEVTLRSLTQDGRVLVNGVPIDSQFGTVLNPNDRLVFGATQMWLFRHPALETEAGVSDSPMINYDFILHEMATKSGSTTFSSFLDNQDLLQEELGAILPSIEEANSISAEMNKHVQFKIVLVAPQNLVVDPGAEMVLNQMYIKMKNLDHGIEYIWSKEKFLIRFNYMREMYRHHQMGMNAEEGHDGDFHITDERDPFSESTDAVVIIGMARIYLQSLAYLVELRDQVPVTDLRGIQIGFMKFALIPCADSQGHELREENLINSSNQLIGRNLFYKFNIISCRNLPSRFRDLHCKYRFYDDKVDGKTEMHPYSTNVKFNHSRILRFEPATREFIDYLNHGSVVVEILGKHIINDHSINQPHPMSNPINTKQLNSAMDHALFTRKREILAQNPVANSFESVFETVHERKQELISELQLLKHKHIRLEQRLDFIRQMTERCLLVGQDSIPTTLLDAMLNVNNSEEARDIVQRLQIGEDDDDWIAWSAKSRQKEHRSTVCSIS